MNSRADLIITEDGDLLATQPWREIAKIVGNYRPRPSIQLLSARPKLF